MISRARATPPPIAMLMDDGYPQRLRQPSREQRVDREEAEEDQRVEAHHPSPQRIRDEMLDHRVRQGVLHELISKPGVRL